MKKQLFTLATLLMLGVSSMWASVADNWKILPPDPDEGFGALMPYTRYDSEEAILGGGAYLKKTTTWDRMDITTQASKQSYVVLPSSGAYAEWTMNGDADGVTMRFTMPDSSDGMGLDGSLDIYVNGVKVKTVDLTSYFMYQYFSSGHPSDSDNGGAPCFAFDETHFTLGKYIHAGDRIRVQSSGASGLEYGVDFLETEVIEEEIECPSGAVNVMDFGAVPNDGKDDLDAFKKALAAADSGSKILYIPAGTWHLSGIWYIFGKDVKITGAGIWYTNLKFTNPNAFGGGISGGNGSNGPDGYCTNMEICNFYLNSSLRSRHNEQAVYKCFMDVFAGGSVLHDLWEDHFECGMWIADYNGQMDYSDGIKIINCRLRNNLADGVNFCMGTSNGVVYNCNLRNNGDDGLAMWNNTNGAKDEYGNIFCYNTIDFIWRAGGIAIYGGDGHKIYNNFIQDMYMASGIHLNTTFPGAQFQNTKNIEFINNCLVRCGTNSDSWNEDLAAIDLKQSVKNVSFKNTWIFDSPFDAIRVLNGPSNITFDDTKILGSALSGGDCSFSCVTHSCGAIRLQGEGVNFNNTVITNVTPQSKNNNSTWPIWTDNSKDMAESIGYNYVEDMAYTIPAERVKPNPIIDDMWATVSDYNLKLEGITYYNDSKTAIKEGDRVTIGCSVKNTSNVDIPEKAKIVVKYSIDGTNYSYTHTNGLKAGETIKIYFDQKWTATAGGHVATATVDPDNKADRETDENDNTRTKRFDVAESTDNNIHFDAVSGGIDLQVLKVTCDKETYDVGDQLVFSALVVNAGDQAVPAGQKIGLQFQVDGETYATGHITWCDNYLDGLQPGEMVTLTANGGGGASGTSGNYWTATDSSHTITAWVDDQDSFEEVDESNNKMNIEIKVPYGGIVHEQNPEYADDLENGGLIITTDIPTPDPDPTPTDPWQTVSNYNLKLEGVTYFNDTKTAIKAGDLITIGCSVKNTSNVDIPEKAKVIVNYTLDNNKYSYTHVNGIKAGETIKIYFDKKWTATAGGHTATAIVDPTNLANNETDETDNTRTKRFDVAEVQETEPVYVPVKGGMDLQVLKVSFDKQTINAGDQVVFSALVVNAGDQAVPAGQKIGVQFQFDGKTYGTGHITWCDEYKNGLQPGEKVLLTANGGGGENSTPSKYWTATAGQHTITAWVDDTDLYNEVNEDNNELTISLSIPYGGIAHEPNPEYADDLENGGLIITDDPEPDPDPTPDPEPEPEPEPEVVATDLALTGLSWENEFKSSNLNEGDNVTYTVAVINLSSNDIEAGDNVNVSIAVDGNTVLSTTYHNAIPAGESVIITLPTTWKALGGGHEVTASVAVGEGYVDENDADNSRTKRINIIAGDSPVNPVGSYTPVSGGYDLYVTDILFSRSDINAGDAVTFSAVIVNAGDRDIPAGTIIGAQFQIDGNTSVITWSDNYSGGLKSHEYVTITACGGTNSSQWTAINGAHTVTAWVDDVNRIEGEVDENNNKKTIDLTIPFVKVQYFDYPDNPDSFTSGDVPGEDISTGISATQNAQNSQSVYDLCGRKVADSTCGLTHGMYIVGGKKFVVK